VNQPKTITHLKTAAALLAALAMNAGADQTTNQSPSLTLTEKQLPAIKLGQISKAEFPVHKEAIGNIDFNEDVAVQVYPPFQGRILEVFVQLDDTVSKGQPLYTVDSPDLLNAENNLITAAAIYDLTHAELIRAKELFKEGNSVAQRELEQATSDEQSATGGLTTARDTVRIFGKSDAEIDQIVASRKSDSVLVVKSPVNGKVTARNAQTGLFVQPGNAPAPLAVADLETKWLVANVSESDAPAIKAGQPLKASVMAFPGKIFQGKVDALASAVDPNTHRLMVRSQIKDPEGLLQANMLATFVIETAAPKEYPCITINGVVRNGDGTHVAWVTTDGHKFTERFITVGEPHDGLYPVLEGLQPGEQVITDNAVFVSNMLEAPVDD
jgi:cobalt-zinc-cadmium efflux system membrane fusion protein